MSTVQEIEDAITQLTPDQLADLRHWFAEYDAQTWDKEFESDASSGALDWLAEEARADLREGRCTER